MTSLVTSGESSNGVNGFEPTVVIQIGNNLKYGRRAAALFIHCENKLVSLVS